VPENVKKMWLDWGEITMKSGAWFLRLKQSWKEGQHCSRSEQNVNGWV
jgi:hypothetical protein